MHVGAMFFNRTSDSKVCSAYTKIFSRSTRVDLGDVVTGVKIWAGEPQNREAQQRDKGEK